MRPSRYIDGGVISSPSTVVLLIEAGKPVFWNGDIYSNAFMLSQQIRTIIIHTKKGAFHFARERTTP